MFDSQVDVSPTILEGEADPGYFQVKIAHYFIIGVSLFSIFWGMMNVLMVSIRNSLADLIIFGVDQRNQLERLTVHRQGAQRVYFHQRR